MKLPASTPAIPGLGRRGFLSAGGGLLAGAGLLSLPGTAEALSPAVHGLPPIYPADPRYATLQMGFNRRWAGSPAYIQVVRNARQTVAAVQRAHDAGLRITVRGGGHCYENFSSGNHGGVIIDLSGMQDVSLDPSGLVRVAGGATLWNVYETLFKDYNLTLPGGSCYSVGAGGHIVGGGNFGIVTAYYFTRLPQPPVQVRLATTSWPGPA